MREKVLAGAPACIIASSGMLTGGPSQFYASRLADDPRHAIIFCGYQDEESPGRRLLALADDPEATIALGGVEKRVRCRLAQYGLSAHADAGELASLAARLRPRRVVLVHGDDDARQALAQTLADSRRAVLAPENGQWLDFSFRHDKLGKYTPASAARAAKAVSGHERGGPPNPEVLWDGLVRGPSTRNKLYTAEELAVLWFGGGITPERQAQMAAMLKSDRRYFAADWKHPYFYRPAVRIRWRRTGCGSLSCGVCLICRANWFWCAMAAVRCGPVYATRWTNWGFTPGKWVGTVPGIRRRVCWRSLAPGMSRRKQIYYRGKEDRAGALKPGAKAEWRYK